MRRKMSIRREEEGERWSVSDSGECNVIGGKGFIWVLGIEYWVLVYLTHLLKLWRCKVGKICRKVLSFSFLFFSWTIFYC